MPRRLWVMMLWLVLAASCSGAPAQNAATSPEPTAAPPAAAAAPAQAPPPAPFVLGAGDVITITVWRFDDLKRTVQIDPSGYISFPFAGQVLAAGLTQDQLKRELEAKLAAYYQQPVVDIGLQSQRSATAHVLGEVKTPSAVALDKKTLLTEAIARAGGLTTDADPERVLLFRKEGDVARAQVVSLRLSEEAPAGSAPFKLIYLQSDDVVYVPPTRIVDFTRFLSQVTGVLDPIMGVGRGVIIGDQVYKVFRNTSDTGVVVQP